MSLLFPNDENGNSIPVLGFRNSSTQTLTADGTAKSLVIPFDDDDQELKIITIISEDVVRFEVGNASTSANLSDSAILFPGIYLDLPITAKNNRLSVRAQDTACEFFLMERG